MGTKRVGWARIRSLINENTNTLQMQKRICVELDASSTLTAADSGKIFWINSGGGAVDTVLPAVATGLTFTLE